MLWDEQLFSFPPLPKAFGCPPSKSHKNLKNFNGYKNRIRVLLFTTRRKESGYAVWRRWVKLKKSWTKSHLVVEPRRNTGILLDQVVKPMHDYRYRPSLFSLFFYRWKTNKRMNIYKKKGIAKKVRRKQTKTKNVKERSNSNQEKSGINSAWKQMCWNCCTLFICSSPSHF